MEIKDVIIEFLKKNSDKRFSVKELERKLDKYSYPTILKWVSVLEVEKKIIIEAHGNVKLVYYNGK